MLLAMTCKLFYAPSNNYDILGKFRKIIICDYMRPICLFERKPLTSGHLGYSGNSLIS